MFIHFDNKDKAADHLIGNGWRQPERNARWVSKDGSCRATMMPVRGSDETVCVMFEEI